uniref:Uncharacterized protein LOC102807105 n=1 Tax=Saccoglossus kowalevskii TaxID=10224 RepID=A0ABM0M9X6_SACKO|nr:PREDICTED: uncharacterized protein LOC102807105 [Saccoglossus kowalevskii]
MAQNTFLIGILLVTVQAQQQFQPEPYLIFANSFDIRKLNFDGTNYRRLVEGLLNVVALDYDYASGYIYWSDHLTRKIQRAEIDNAQNTVEDFVVDDIEVPDGIAVDWKNRKLFFTDRIRSVIEKIGLDGTNRIVLITTNIYEPRGIALDPHSDWFYFTDVYDAQPTIQKARMSDGSQQTTIISTGLAKPNAITVDYIDRMIYWADATTDKVESCDLNGNARQVLVDNPSTFHPYGLTQYDDRIYWTDQQLHHIVNLNKHDKNDKVIITGYFSYPTAIHVVHPDRQLGTEIDSCQHNDGRGECDHICIDLYGSYMCACRQGYHLQTDEHTCDDTNECSINNGGCSHHCLNIESSFFCTCINGYTLQADQRTCRDTNECHISNGGCQFSCHNTDSSYYCSCPSGYTLESNKITCHDIDECVTGSNPCPSNALCQNVPGSYQCICGSGFHFNKVTRQCEDTNECTSANNMCSQRCVNTGGSFRCECNIGYTLQEDGSTCIDINECNVANDCQQQCTNILGSYVCSCTVGSILNADGKSCRPTTCQPPPPRPGFTITCQETSHLYLSRCDIDCDLGTLVGSNSITCLSNSEWSILTAECIGISGKTENDPPIATYLTSNVIPEDADNGDIVGYLRSIDSDPMQTFTYFLRDDADPFYIGSHDTLRTRGMLDFETMTQYTVSILATDDGIPPESLISSLIVYVINVNEPPGQPMWQQTTISENANVGDVVTLLNALDPDEGQQLNFTLITNSNGKFSMVNNALVVNRPLDYETNRHHQIHIQVRDNGMPIQTNSAVFELDIIDENEPPLKINFIGSDVPEFTAGGDTVTGKVIGRFETEDPDQGDTHTYSLDTLNACFDIQGSDLLVGNVDCFNYETHPFYLLSVQASDSGGLSVRTTIRIGIIDVNEPPTGVTLSTNTIMEHVPLNTVVGTLTALDEDTADTHIFTLLNSNGLFAIEGHTVKVAADLNYETFPTGVGFEVRCIDSDSNSITVSMMVFLGNENEEPNDISVVINKPCSFGHVGPNGVIIDACIPETTAPNDLVALVAASDPDGDTLSITMIDSSGKFMLTDNLRIQLGPEKLNYESDSYGHIFQVTLISSDPNGLTKEKDLYFEVNIH